MQITKSHQSRAHCFIHVIELSHCDRIELVYKVEIGTFDKPLYGCDVTWLEEDKVNFTRIS
ncbi:hypothetical protein [Priestia taiwanensis]|uniref:Uncharacterized protein n=1 Tax=Priestia taiwanensis TaxID=1347902 RepID=A0A917EPL8_9BACI|nr:hypothetical protein [Priestia taiwanensis]MBM7363281.1 hypothetical protein [Priestia taiwanensis]GGE69135.1 hypothetical protein GCM10007140_19000 [Priestia taiwanensis]